MPFATERAKELGFDLVATVEKDMVPCKRELRDLCDPKVCEHYGTSWSCPPGAGTFEQCAATIAAKSKGVLVQSIHEGVDFNDVELLDQIRAKHNLRLDCLAHDLRQLHGEALEFTTGGCNLCDSCLYPDAPCALPERHRLALSAHGVDVAELCERAGMEYSFENGTIRFIGLVMY